MIETVLPIDYYSIIAGVLVDQRIFIELLRIKMPQLVAHLQTVELDLALLAFKWFMCLFTNCLPDEVADQIDNF